MLGREVYRKFVLFGDGGFANKTFLNALRFSTHGEFYVERWLSSSLRSSPHFHINSSKVSESDIYKKIAFSQNYFDIGISSCSPALLGDPVLVPYCNDRPFAVIDYIVNADGALEYVCSISDAGLPCHSPVKFTEVAKNCALDTRSLLPGTVISGEVLQYGGDLVVDLQKNRVGHHWNLYRAIGINIPLLVIQILLGRNVKTVPFVDSSRLLINGEKVSYVINDVKTFWFDLDETLICRWEPITPVIDLLKWLKSCGCQVGLITRHTFDIEQTLNRINLRCSIFDRVIKVSPDEKKSSYCGSEDFFIDNEFAERLDVRSKSGATVLDVDQIEFIRAH
jgi:hypothetical protein